VSAAARHRIAVELLDLRRDDVVLDVGCGHGVATELALAAVPDGRVVALDRSPTMADAIRHRLPAAVAEGRLEVLTSSLSGADLPAGGFDGALAVNVIGLVADHRALEAVVRSLAPDGRVAFVFEPPSTDRVAAVREAAWAAFDRADLAIEADLEGAERVALLGRRPT
jgi:cyclopropane fatty-acyl-phospholipid synthase-like methyltransferase